MFQTYLDIRDVTGLVSIYHEFDHPCVFEWKISLPQEFIGPIELAIAP